MKKIIALALSLLLWLPTLAVAADEPVTVYVTIADADGKLALTQEEITVTDADEDGTLSIYDALYAAHEAKYEGGAAAGFAASAGQYGVSLDKLWGTANGGSYGYYVNHQSATNLTDAVKDGDSISAYCFTDLTTWSDTYCWFDTDKATAKAGETLSLTLSSYGYDANWAPVVNKVADATILIDGKETAYKTDADGKVTLTLDLAAGDHIISATSATQTLVPPACVVAVSGAPTTTTTTTTATTTTTEAAESTSPETGDSTGMAAVAVLAVLTVLACGITGRKKSYEK